MIHNFIVRFFLFSGMLFFLTTAIALIRFPDFYSRMHAASKCLIGGGISILIALIIREGPSPLSFRLLLLIVFLLITNPVVGHALSRASYHYGHVIKMTRDDLHERIFGDD